jgi:hypothetical protein
LEFFLCEMEKVFPVSLAAAGKKKAGRYPAFTSVGSVLNAAG